MTPLFGAERKHKPKKYKQRKRGDEMYKKSWGDKKKW